MRARKSAGLVIGGGRKEREAFAGWSGFAVTLKIQSENSWGGRGSVREAGRERVEGLKAARIGLTFRAFRASRRVDTHNRLEN